LFNVKANLIKARRNFKERGFPCIKIQSEDIWTRARW